MARRIYLLAPSAIACVIFGCGGASDPGLFSASGGKSGVSGASSVGATSGSSAGSTAAGGDSSNAGGVGLGGDDTGGESAGGNNSAGSDTGGTGAGEAGHSGSAGSVDRAGMDGGAGHAEGGSAGHAEGGSAGHAEGGTGTGGTDVAGSTSSGGKTGSAGAAGGGNGPTCSELLTQAATELTAARACNVALNAQQCTGTVETTCNCEVPVEKDNSPATKAYQATLKQIQTKRCVQACPAIACSPVINAQCRASTPSSTQGSCVAGFAMPTPGTF
jgi:hypothetical protein